MSCNENTNKELKTCPFCDGEAATCKDLDDDTYYVQCQGCGVSTPLRDSLKGAIEIWNRRKVNSEKLLEIAHMLDMSIPWSSVNARMDFGHRIKVAMGLTEKPVKEEPVPEIYNKIIEVIDISTGESIE